MDTTNNSLYYSVILGILIAGAYSLSNINFGTVSARICSTLQLSQVGKLEKSNASAKTANPDIHVTTPSLCSTWWTDEDLFQLERRAIFSKTWLYVTHRSNFENPGDYRTFEIAGFSVIVILGKDNQIRAFHNVCRHRAYAVTKKECGSSTVLRCRYHGWSYDSRGKLIKAPEFENVKNFEKDLNGLWEVRTEIRESMIFLNLDSGNEVTSQALSGIDYNLRQWIIKDMAILDGWKIKVLCGGSRKAKYSVLSKFFSSREDLDVFDTAILRRFSSGHVLTISKLINNLREDIRLTVQELELQQHSLVHGSMEMSNDKQASLKQLLLRHKNAEENLGAEIHPAARRQSFTEDGRDDDKLCRDIEEDMLKQTSFCSANARGLLDW